MTQPLIPYDFPGDDNGFILIGRLVDARDPRILAAQTSRGYIDQGSLRECLCKRCLRVFFISSYALLKRTVKSCGCSRLGRIRQAYKTKQDLKQMRSLVRAHKLARAQNDPLEERRLYNIIMEVRKYRATKEAE